MVTQWHTRTQAKGAKTLSVIEVTDSPVQVISQSGRRISVLIQNTGSSAVYLGPDDGVTTENGIRLDSGMQLVDDTSFDAWWAVTSSGTVNLRVAEVRSS